MRAALASEGAIHITLASTINRNYWVPFEVLVASLLHAKRNTTTVTWHVATDETLAWDAWLERMHTRYGARGATFVPHHLGALSGRPLPLRGRARPIMYARLLVPDMVAAGTGRLLYLDADMLVLHPIEELWNSELGELPCAYCQDLAIPLVSSVMAIRDHQALGLVSDAPYFNAGVMLIDTTRWCAESVGERASGSPISTIRSAFADRGREVTPREQYKTARPRSQSHTCVTVFVVTSSRRWSAGCAALWV